MTVRPVPRPMTDTELARTVDMVCRAAADRRGEVASVVIELVDALVPLATETERDHLVRRSIARLDGLDVLGTLLDDPSVDEVMVNRGSEVWTDRSGRLERCGDLPPGAVDIILERVLAPLGRRLDRHTPSVDARLPDGARLCAVVDPVAIDGTTVSIRRHRMRAIPLAGFAAPPVVELLRSLTIARANVLVTGATSTGKTTVLAALVGLLDPSERLVVVEDTAELVFDDRHVVRLETRPATVDGIGAIDAAQLVRTALRLRPDRLVIGEFRGAEAVAVVEALNTGHDGSLSTCHANSAVDGLRRVETLVMQSVPTWPLAAIRRQVSRSIDVVIHLHRRAEGGRAIAEVVEVCEGDGEPTVRPLAEGNRVVGTFGRGRR
jgi:pilus assembly protein CpaF